MSKRCGLLLALFLVGTSTLAQAVPAPWTIGFAATQDDAEATSPSITLQRTSFTVNIVGGVAMGMLVQEFRNDGTTDALALYAGHAPDGVELLATELEIDGRKIEGAVALPEPEPKPAPRSPRGARRARAKPVDLQSRVSKPLPVPSGALITVRSAFSLELTLDDGLFRLALPAIQHNESVPKTGEEQPVPTIIPSDIELTVLHDHPLPLIESSSHNILSGFDRDRTWIELAARDEPSRPFEMTFALGSTDEPTFVGYVGPESDGARDVTVLFVPATEPTDEAVRPKQLLFILDTSGSMNGDKLDNAKLALASCLDKLGPTDQVNLTEFDAEYTLFQAAPVEAQRHRGAAHQWLESQQAQGGTRLMPALRKTLEQPVSAAHHRMIIVMTDGNLADEKLALKLLEEELGEARLFVVGIGRDVRQDTILRLSEYGRGSAVFVDRPEELETAVSGLFESVSQPLAWDLELDWGGAEVEVIGTERIPDLYAARAVTVNARIRGPLPTEVLLNVTTTEGTRTFRAILPDFVGE